MKRGKGPKDGKQKRVKKKPPKGILASNDDASSFTAGSVRPVFVIGPLRSGVSLLALSLGQHPNIAHVPESIWFERFALGLLQSYTEDVQLRGLSQLSAIGIDAERFFAHFGESINGLLLGHSADPLNLPSSHRKPANGVPGTSEDYRPTRWVDGNYTHSFNVYALQRLFPGARFIHVLRAVNEAVAALTDPENKAVYKSRHVPFTVLDAVEHWLDVTNACVEAERALGSDTVLRIRRMDLVSSPESTLRQCLDFLDEPFDDRCLRPFRPCATFSTAAPQELREDMTGVPAEVRVHAEVLSRALLEEPSPAYSRDEAWMSRLADAFAGRAGMGSLLKVNSIDKETSTETVPNRVTVAGATLPSPKSIDATCRSRLDNNEPMAAWTTLEPLDDEAISQQLLVRTARSLRHAGYLSAACRAFERAVTRDPKDDALRAALERVLGEVKVLRGSWTPPTVEAVPVRPIHRRVLHLVGKSLPYNESGYAVRTQYVTQAQRAVGLDPYVVTQLGFPWNLGVDDASPYDIVEGTPYLRLNTRSGLPQRLDDRLSLNATGLHEIVRQVQPSVLHASSDYLNALLALAIGRQYGLPVVYEVRGFWEDTWLSGREPAAVTRESYMWRAERELECMLAADRVVTLSDAMKEELGKRGVSLEKIVVIPNAVDTQAFVPVHRDVGLAGEFGIGPEEIVLGYVSSFSGYEGIQFLIEAVAELIRRGHAVRGLLVGDGPDKSRLEAHAASLGLPNRIVFTGRVPHADILQYYGLIDVFVVPRTADRVSHLVTPLKPFEAMATGRTVVVSGVQALRELVGDGVRGLVFRPEDSVDLANVVESLLSNRERREALGRAAREWVCQYRTWASNGERYLAMYNSLGV
jgi:PEP-CTERM/exosortase A-associated glycosyltransferase